LFFIVKVWSLQGEKSWVLILLHCNISFDKRTIRAYVEVVGIGMG
jgi:hypothetical protein